jgi:hypothetical protein
MIYLNTTLGSAQSYGIWVLDFVCFGLTIPAIILIIIGLQGITNNILPRDHKFSKFVMIMFIVYLSLYSFLSLVFTILIPNNTNSERFIMIKNLITIFFLAMALLSASFLFNRIQRSGYKTRMMFIPMIFLPIPSFVGLIMGFWIISISSLFDSTANDSLRISVQILLTYLVLCLIAAFIEFLVVITVQMQDLEQTIPRRRVKRSSRTREN